MVKTLEKTTLMKAQISSSFHIQPMTKPFQKISVKSFPGFNLCICVMKSLINQKQTQ